MSCSVNRCEISGANDHVGRLVRSLDLINLSNNHISCVLTIELDV